MPDDLFYPSHLLLIDFATETSEKKQKSRQSGNLGI